MRKFAPEWVARFLTRLGMAEGEDITHPMVTKAITRAQKKVEAYNFEIRKNLLEYDEVMDIQRKEVYGLRQSVLEGDEKKQHAVIDRMIRRVVDDHAESSARARGARRPTREPEELAAWFRRHFARRRDGRRRRSRRSSRRRRDSPASRSRSGRGARPRSTPALMRRLERFLLLNSIDAKWKDHLRAMDALKTGVGLRGYGQMDPKVEFKTEGHKIFSEMIRSIREEVTDLLFKIRLREEDERHLADRWAGAPEAPTTPPRRDGRHVDRRRGRVGASTGARGDDDVLGRASGGHAHRGPGRRRLAGRSVVGEAGAAAAPGSLFVADRRTRGVPRRSGRRARRVGGGRAGLEGADPTRRPEGRSQRPLPLRKRQEVQEVPRGGGVAADGRPSGPPDAPCPTGSVRAGIDSAYAALLVALAPWAAARACLDNKARARWLAYLRDVPARFGPRAPRTHARPLRLGPRRLGRRGEVRGATGRTGRGVDPRRRRRRVGDDGHGLSRRAGPLSGPARGVLPARPVVDRRPHARPHPPRSHRAGRERVLAELPVRCRPTRGIPVALVNGRMSARSASRFRRVRPSRARHRAGADDRVRPTPRLRRPFPLARHRRRRDRRHRQPEVRQRPAGRGPRAIRRVRAPARATGADAGDDPAARGRQHPPDGGAGARARDPQAPRGRPCPLGGRRAPSPGACRRGARPTSSARGSTVVRRSRLARATPLAPETVVLLDTVGELEAIYSLADVVFVGGSLIRHGGQSMMEPASLGKPVLVGPHTFNFRGEVDLLVATGGIGVVDGRGAARDAARRVARRSGAGPRRGRARTRRDPREQGRDGADDRGAPAAAGGARRAREPVSDGPLGSRVRPRRCAGRRRATPSRPTTRCARPTIRASGP